MKFKARKFDSTLFLLWPLLLLVAWLSPLLPTVGIPGYRWTVELAFAFFLLLVILVCILGRTNFRFSAITSGETLFVILPIAFFVIWSFTSVLWAQSWRSTFHHSLVWACYLIYMVLARSIYNDADRLSKTL